MKILKMLGAALLPLMAACTALAQETGLVSTPVASLRAAPSHSAELETQALMGTPVKLMERKGDWIAAEVLPTGYRAFIHRSAVQRLTPAQMQQWRSAGRYIVTSPLLQYLTTDTLAPSPANVVTDLVYGCVLEPADSACEAGSFVRLRTPAGKEGWIDARAVEPFAAFAAAHRGDADEAPTVTAYARMLLGSTYLWGGNSMKFVDCSGLTTICYAMAGIQLPRNASQQALQGEPVPLDDPSQWREGDLVFFANPSTGRVNHVAIKLRGDSIIHSAGTVHITPLDRSHPEYRGRKFHSVRRVLGTPAAQKLRLALTPAWFAE